MSASMASSTTIGLLLLLLLSVVQYASAESIITQAQATGKFTILDAAIQKFDIAGVITLLGGAKVTIFGPTDAALTAAGITDGATQLTEPILLQHALINELYTANLKTVECQEFKAMDQTTLVVQTASDGSLTVNGVTINTAYADIAGDEGVFHGIDGVIPTTYPSCPTAAPAGAPSSSATVSMRLGAVVAAAASSIFLSWVL